MSNIKKITFGEELKGFHQSGLSINTKEYGWGNNAEIAHLIFGSLVPFGKNAFVAASGIYLPTSNNEKNSPKDEKVKNLWDAFGDMIMNKAQRKVTPQFMIPYGSFSKSNYFVVRKTVLFGSSLQSYLLEKLDHGGVINENVLDWKNGKISEEERKKFLGLTYRSPTLTLLSDNAATNLEFRTVVDNNGNRIHIAENPHTKYHFQGNREYHLFEKKTLNGEVPIGLNRLTRAISALSTGYDFNLVNSYTLEKLVTPFVPAPDWQKAEDTYYVRLKFKTGKNKI